MPDGTIEEFTSYVLNLIDAAGIQKFIIGGHSLGGMMAIEMIDHTSERVDGIISCEGWTHSDVQLDAFDNQKDETLTPLQVDLITHYKTEACRKWTDKEIASYQRIWHKWEKGYKLLKMAEMPILEIWGDRGIKEKPNQNQLQIPCKKNIRLVWMENCGHFLLVQRPALLGKEIAEFITGLSYYSVG